MTLDPDIESHYALGLERARLREDLGRLEFIRTRELLTRYLPRPPGTVIDVGGGPGAYAVPLAIEGYDVHLLDPVSLHVKQALAAARTDGAALASAVVGDARELRTQMPARTRRCCSGRCITSPTGWTAWRRCGRHAVRSAPVG